MERRRRMRRWIRNLIYVFVNFDIIKIGTQISIGKGGAQGKKGIVGSSSRIIGVSQFTKLRGT